MLLPGIAPVPSTDGSVELAKSLGCQVVSWSSGNINDVLLKKNISNNCWKSVGSGWIIMIDMDEWLCITEQELKTEMEQGTTILTVQGIDMIGESERIDLTDIDLHSIVRYVDHENESKKLCFLREKINDMNYNGGAHKCNPVGKIQYSKKSGQHCFSIQRITQT